MMSHDATTFASSSPAFQPTHTTPSTPVSMLIASPSPTQIPTTRGGKGADDAPLSAASATAASYSSTASRWTCWTACCQGLVVVEVGHEGLRWKGVRYKATNVRECRRLIGRVKGAERDGTPIDVSLTRWTTVVVTFGKGAQNGAELESCTTKRRNDRETTNSRITNMA